MPACTSTHDGADVSDVLLPGGRFMKIVFEFKYLGSVISSSGDDADDVDSRIASAGKAFGALRGCIFSSTSISRKAKRAVYEVLVLSILLYGSESWSMVESMIAHFGGVCRVCWHSPSKSLCTSLMPNSPSTALLVTV